MQNFNFLVVLTITHTDQHNLLIYDCHSATLYVLCDCECILSAWYEHDQRVIKLKEHNRPVFQNFCYIKIYSSAAAVTYAMTKILVHQNFFLDLQTSSNFQ